MVFIFTYIVYLGIIFATKKTTHNSKASASSYEFSTLAAQNYEIGQIHGQLKKINSD